MESANWQIDLAMASFYEGEGDGDMDVGGPAAEAVAPPPAADPQAAKAGAGAGTGSIGRINFSGGGSDSDDSDSEQQAFFAGGSSHSGNVVRITTLGEIGDRNIVSTRDFLVDSGPKEEEIQCW